MCHRAGLGDEPRKVFDEIAQIQTVDVTKCSGKNGRMKGTSEREHASQTHVTAEVGLGRPWMERSVCSTYRTSRLLSPFLG